jgi:RNA binding exosome subunit
MLVAKEHREKLALYQLVTKQSQEQAANQAIAQMLERVDRDPELKARMDRAQALQQELASL